MRRLAALFLAALAAPLLAFAQSSPPSTFLATDRPVAANEVKVGVSCAQTGRAGAIGADYLRGARAYFERLNSKEGGVHGRKVKLIAYDDRFEPLPAILNTRRLVNEDKVFALLDFNSGVGSRAVGQMISDAQLPLIGTFTGLQALRQPLNRYLFNVRPGYNEETSVIVDRLITDRQTTKIAVFYQDDLDGAAILSGVQRALRGRGMTFASSTSVIRNSVEVTAAVEAMLLARPDAIVLGTTYGPAAALVQGLKARGFSPIFCATSFVGADAFAEAAGPAADGTYVTEVVPSPTDPSLRIVASFIEDMKAANEFGSTQVALEGYINAAVLAQGLRDTGPNLNTAAFVRTMEGMNVDLGGPVVTFTPSSRQGMKEIYLSCVRQGLVTKVDNFNP
jgi:branched-chain amino acid transport system substrate-binding protein